MSEQCVDLSGESIVLPEELSGLLVEESGFLSRPCILPDELRGALLLPSEDSGSLSAGQNCSSSLGREDGPAEEDDGTCSSPLSRGVWEAAVQEDRRSEGSGRGNLALVSSPALSTTPSVGLGGARDGGSSLSHSSKSNKSRDWSLSDTDLRELLERGSGLDFPSPLHAAGALGAGSLASVPELQDAAPLTSARGAPPPPSPATTGSPATNSPGQPGATALAAQGAGKGLAVEGSPSQSTGTRSLPASAASSPPQSTNSRSHATAWTSVCASSARSPSLASGPASGSLAAAAAKELA